MSHDPLCPAPKCEKSYSSCIECDPAHEPCLCQCDLIVKVRDQERWATVESAVFVASQSGAVPELVQLLSKLYEAPEVQIDDEMRREAARELTQLAQEMGMIP